MDKRYQVFVSSTYADLKEERQNVIQALMEMDCIPAGMELFPASDEEQWEFIKKIIDDCDYYLLIIGGRYGSLSADGISYTEKEFDYAVEKGLKVVALVHGEPNNIPFEKSETNPELREKLISFRQKVTTNRLVRFWTIASELPGLVALSLSKTIKMFPAVGWIRADKLASNDVLTELIQVKNENENLKKELSDNSNKLNTQITDIADFASTFTAHGYYTNSPTHDFFQDSREFKGTFSWNSLFSFLSPFILKNPTNLEVNAKIGEYIAVTNRIANFNEAIINEYDFDTITIQLKAYGLVNVSTLTERWELTGKGESLMIQERVIRK
ncbi:UNVERIFIED_ORG: uncharacterized protein DUF4062 [Providencia alcalifaciens]